MPILLPWTKLQAAGWLIVGMNHYSLHGELHLYVAVMREGRALVAQGTDQAAVFAELEAQAGLG